MKLRCLFLLATLASLAGCTTHQKEYLQDGGTAIKDAGTAVGHATRDVTRETGHFFRDIFSGNHDSDDEE